MSADSRFSPPRAAVADVDGARRPHRALAIVLAMVTLLQFALFLMLAPLVLRAVGDGLASPIGLLWLALGELCLVVGSGLMVWRAHRGRRGFLLAFAFFLFNRYSWRLAWFLAVVPVGAGLLIAAVAGLILWNRRPMMASAETGRSPSP